MFEYLIFYHSDALPFSGIKSLVGWEFHAVYDTPHAHCFMVFRRPGHGRIRE